MLCKSIIRFSFCFTRNVCRSFHMSGNSNYKENESTKCVNTNNTVKPPRILITGGLGQLGTECAKLLRRNYGNENVILTDIIKPTEESLENGPFIFADILDFKGLQKIVVDYRIDWLIHFSALLSAVGEQNVPLAVRVNIEDYAVAVFHEGLLNRRYECYLEPHTMLPMIYIEDCLSALFQFLNTPDKLLRRRVYNVTAMSFTPEELFKELLKYIPDLKITYKPDKRQYIAENWPQVFDDSEARRDWGWQHEYNLERLVKSMVQDVSTNFLPKHLLTFFDWCTRFANFHITNSTIEILIERSQLLII
ncbi:L-threonine 3-dehydrogenase, mitochondrial isoform X3 [Formica exsecta]|uniref:L-threonine 3-dehydrogenase, mitochondrial isoform X3 n=1 Tax=Formica exsecta TaxID=72781 RepID=UPI001144642F|nr:L-threonine 3-dehydrogenase, mitochondrial isoform X3 [Formica exsecta]